MRYTFHHSTRPILYRTRLITLYLYDTGARFCTGTRISLGIKTGNFLLSDSHRIVAASAPLSERSVDLKEELNDSRAPKAKRFIVPNFTVIVCSRKCWGVLCVGVRCTAVEYAVKTNDVLHTTALLISLKCYLQ